MQNSDFIVFSTWFKLVWIIYTWIMNYWIMFMKEHNQIPSQVYSISKILFIDTEKLSKMQISLQVFFKEFVERFGITYLKNRFLWSCFSKTFLIDFRIATNLKTGLSKKYSLKILFIDFKISTTKIIQLKVH